MSLLSRLTTETGTPMPRYLYLLLKPVESIAIAVGVASLTGLPVLKVAWATVLVYTAIGLVLWYRHGVKQWLGPGSFTGDAMYHGLLCLPAPIVVSSIPIVAKWALLAACAALWLVLEHAGFGPMRAPLSSP